MMLAVSSYPEYLAIGYLLLFNKRDTVLLVARVS